MSIPVSNFTITESYSITALEINVMNVTLFNSANIRVCCFDESNVIVKCYSYTLTGDDYTNWGSNDDYIVNYVKIQLGIQ
jgi:hypothetical protein